MPNYILSQKADEDLVNIFLYSIEQFGEQKAESYLLGLESVLNELAENPQLGKRIDFIREGYRQRRYLSHQVFYKEKRDTIFVVRILGEKMDAPTHL